MATRKKVVRKKAAAAGTSRKKKSSRGAGTSSRVSAVVTKDADRRTMKKLEGLSERVVVQSLAMRDPFVDIPMRAVSNTRYNKSKRILEMGSNTQRRNLFNMSQARKFMQTLLHASGSKDLIDAGKTLSLRGMFYRNLRKVAGTSERTFHDQTESDAILEDLEVGLDALREELHIYADPRGAMVGNITIVDSGDEIDCRHMGSGGYSLPSIVEPDVIQFRKCEAEFVLHVEKNTVWQRFNEDRFWEIHNCILTHGGGQPSRGVRRLLHRFNRELKLPIYCLLDCDPWGYYIYSVIKQGSIALAFESQRMAVPDARFIGIRSKDHERCELSDDVKIDLNDRDVTRAKQIAAYPWFEKKKGWQQEIKTMLANGFKMEVEALISKDVSYVTEEYVPARLADQDFLD